MPDTVAFNPSLEIIEVQSFGVVTKADILDSIDRIQQLQEKHRTERLLVDTRRQESLPNPIEIFEIFSMYPREIKTALLVNKSQTTAKDVELVETVALNRGKRVRIFHDHGAEMEWLSDLQSVSHPWLKR